MDPEVCTQELNNPTTRRRGTAAPLLRSVLAASSGRGSPPDPLSRRRSLTCGVRPLTPFAKDNRMKMYPDDWQVRLTTGVISAICIGAALILVGFDRFWLLMLSILVSVPVGNLLGRLVCRMLFRSASGGPADKENTVEKK